VCLTTPEPTNWPQVQAFVTSIGVIVTFIGVIVALMSHKRTLANTRLSNSAKMVFDLVDIFDSQEYLRHRHDFADKLLHDRAQIDLRRDYPVLEFFEELAYMTKRGVLDKGMVWNSFFWVIEHFYPAVTASPNLLEKARHDSHSFTLYREIIWLYDELCRLSAKEEGSRAYMRPSTDEVRAFLEDEIKLANHK
jgi:hypothetical protein